MVGATALMAVTRYLEVGFGHIAAFQVLHDLRMRIYEQLQRLSMGYHTRSSPPIAAKVIGDVETIEFFTAHAGIQLISAPRFACLLGILMLLFQLEAGGRGTRAAGGDPAHPVAFRTLRLPGLYAIPRRAGPTQRDHHRITSRALVC